MSKCPEREDVLSSFVDGELSPRRCRRVAEHLMECDACAAQAGQYFAVRTYLRGGQPTEAQPSPHFWDKVHQALEVMDAVRSYEPPQPRRQPMRRLAFLGSIGVLLVVLAWGVRFANPAPMVEASTIIRTHHALVAQYQPTLPLRGMPSAAPPNLLHQTEWVPQVSARTQVGTGFMPYTLYQGTSKLISSFTLSRQLLRPSAALTSADGKYSVWLEGNSSMIAWRQGGNWHILTGELSPQQLMAIAEEMEQRSAWGLSVFPE